jgi:hypothetical protein
MSCGGGHLGFSIGIKNKNFVEDLPMIIPGQFGFNCPMEGPLHIFYFYADQKFKMATNAGHRLTLDPKGKCSMRRRHLNIFS